MIRKALDQEVCLLGRTYAAPFAGEVSNLATGVPTVGFR